MRMIPLLANSRIPLARIAASAAIAWVSIACGSEEAPAPPTASAIAAPKPAAPPAPAIASNVNVDERDAQGNPIRFSGTDSRGNPFRATIGEDATIPDGFPDDVPVLPDSKPMAAMLAIGEGSMLTFKSSQDQQAIFDFYKSGLGEQGWTIDTESSFGGQLSIGASKQSRSVTVTISGTRGDSRIGIVVVDGSRS